MSRNDETDPGEERGRNDPFAPKPPPPGAITDDDEAEFGSNLAAQALAFAAQAPPLRGGAASTPAAAASRPPAAAAPPPAPPAASPRAAVPPAASAAPAARSANPFATNPAAEQAVDDDEIFGANHLAAAALAFASQAPPLHGAAGSERRAAMAPEPVHAAAPAPVRAASEITLAGPCQVVESRDGHKVLWDVAFASGGGVVVILTRAGSVPAELRPLPAHVSWRSADAIAPSDTEAFAQVLSRAAAQAQTLPVATLKA